MEPLRFLGLAHRLISLGKVSLHYFDEYSNRFKRHKMNEGIF